MRRSSLAEIPVRRANSKMERNQALNGFFVSSRSVPDVIGV